VSSSLIGRKLGKYKVIERLGQGGMAMVYTGYQEEVDRRVAIKVLPPHPGLDENFAERFRLEARTIARLQHPHILPLYDYGTEDDIVYLVMAYVDGGALEDLIDEGPLPLSRIEKILREVAGALDYAHRQGVIHRDIKPGNILVDSEGHALLADFGIVKLAEGGANLTGSGVVGTPAYMAPEQAQGMEIDSRVDIYALGVVVYQMLTGQQPFTAESTVQLVLKVIQEDPPSVLDLVDGLPDAVGGVMDKVLAKDPDDRYQTATEFADAFSEAVQGSTDVQAVVKARPTQQGTRSTKVLPPEKLEETVASGETAQTVIMHHGTNPFVLLGGFAIIAAAMVLVVLLVVNKGDGSGNQQAETATAQSVVAVTEEGLTQVAAATQLAVPTGTPIPSFGQVSYSSGNAPGDSVSVRVEDLQAPGAGQTYVVWLKNTPEDTVLKLGTLVLDAFGSGALSFTDPDGGLLPAFYDTALISVEESGFDGDAPSGEIPYSGSVPVDIPPMIYEIFVASENGLDGNSLLNGAETEAGIAAQHAGLAAGSSNIGGVITHGEHTLNILRGQNEDYNGNNRGENPGRGVGIYAFLDLIEAELDRAVNMPGTSLTLQTNAELMRVCLDNTRIRADRVVELELEQVAAEDIESITDQLSESERLAQELRTGLDLNQNGQIDPFEGECGLDQMESYGILIGNMEIYAEE
jgi:tRNA A-37 threonylcarbamoyl transferase component Bud32